MLPGDPDFQLCKIHHTSNDSVSILPSNPEGRALGLVCSQLAPQCVAPRLNRTQSYSNKHPESGAQVKKKVSLRVRQHGAAERWARHRPLRKSGRPPGLTKLPTHGLRIRRQRTVLGHQLHLNPPRMVREYGLQRMESESSQRTGFGSRFPSHE